VKEKEKRFFKKRRRIKQGKITQEQIGMSVKTKARRVGAQMGWKELRGSGEL